MQQMGAMAQMGMGMGGQMGGGGGMPGQQFAQTGAFEEEVDTHALYLSQLTTLLANLSDADFMKLDEELAQMDNGEEQEHVLAQAKDGEDKDAALA